MAQVLSPIQTEMAAKGGQIVGACFNPDAQRLVPGFIQQFRPTFPVGWSTNETVMKYIEVPAGVIPYVPILLFIDRSGMIRNQYLGTDPFMSTGRNGIVAKLNELLGPPAAKTGAKG